MAAFSAPRARSHTSHEYPPPMLAGRLRVARVARAAAIVVAVGLVASCGDDQPSVEPVAPGISVWVTNRSALPKYITIVVAAQDGSEPPALRRYLAPPGVVQVGAPVPSLHADKPTFGVVSVADPSCADEATWDLEDAGLYHLTIQADGSSDLGRLDPGDEPVSDRTLAASDICQS
jgi:hypothetical protein